MVRNSESWLGMRQSDKGLAEIESVPRDVNRQELLTAEGGSGRPKLHVTVAPPHSDRAKREVQRGRVVVVCGGE